MSYQMIHKLLVVFALAGTVAVNSHAQNAPSSQTHVSTAGSMATTPSGYIISGQSPLINYVRERDGMGRITDTVQFAAAAYGDVKETTHYFDGLGRPLQTVQRQITPGNSPVDMVTPVVYDAFGREVYKYMPYVASTGNTSDGGLKQDPFTDQNNFFQNIYPTQQPAYTGEQVYYGQTVYESSPLNRVLKTMAPGNSWGGSGNGVSMQYLISTATDSVEIWNIDTASLTYQGNDITTDIPTAGWLLSRRPTVQERDH